MAISLYANTYKSKEKRKKNGAINKVDLNHESMITAVMGFCLCFQNEDLLNRSLRWK